VVLLLAFSNSLAEKTITCKVPSNSQSACMFSGVTLGPNKTVSIKTDPANLDVNSITTVYFLDSSIHSIPSEVFTKFPNLEKFFADRQNIQEIKSDTFWSGSNLEVISLWGNALTFLHRDTFKGRFFQFPSNY
jgi:hypothetical protein